MMIVVNCHEIKRIISAVFMDTFLFLKFFIDCRLSPKNEMSLKNIIFFESLIQIYLSNEKDLHIWA
jgi:hypothetical protein